MWPLPKKIKSPKWPWDAGRKISEDGGKRHKYYKPKSLFDSRRWNHFHCDCNPPQNDSLLEISVPPLHLEIALVTVVLQPEQPTTQWSGSSIFGNGRFPTSVSSRYSSTAFSKYAPIPFNQDAFNHTMSVLIYFFLNCGNDLTLIAISHTVQFRYHMWIKQSRNICMKISHISQQFILECCFSYGKYFPSPLGKSPTPLLRFYSWRGIVLGELCGWGG